MGVLEICVNCNNKISNVIDLDKGEYVVTRRDKLTPQLYKPQYWHIKCYYENEMGRK